MVLFVHFIVAIEGIVIVRVQWRNQQPLNIAVDEGRREAERTIRGHHQGALRVREQQHKRSSDFFKPPVRLLCWNYDLGYIAIADLR
jgi:hypothetical protein